MRVFLAHLVNIGIAFISSFIFICALLFIVVAAISFMTWAIPAIPTTETLLFVLRVVTTISAVITIAYSFSNDYKRYVQEYLAR